MKDYSFSVIHLIPIRDLDFSQYCRDGEGGKCCECSSSCHMHLVRQPQCPPSLRGFDVLVKRQDASPTHVVLSVQQ